MFPPLTTRCSLGFFLLTIVSIPIVALICTLEIPRGTPFELPRRVRVSRLLSSYAVLLRVQALPVPSIPDRRSGWTRTRGRHVRHDARYPLEEVWVAGLFLPGVLRAA